MIDVVVGALFLCGWAALVVMPGLKPRNYKKPLLVALFVLLGIVLL